jgi:hypothetical protein
MNQWPKALLDVRTYIRRRSVMAEDWAFLRSELEIERRSLAIDAERGQIG